MRWLSAHKDQFILISMYIHTSYDLKGFCYVFTKIFPLDFVLKESLDLNHGDSHCVRFTVYTKKIFN